MAETERAEDECMGGSDDVADDITVLTALRLGAVAVIIINVADLVQLSIGHNGDQLQGMPGGVVNRTPANATNAPSA